MPNDRSPVPSVLPTTEVSSSPAATSASAASAKHRVARRDFLKVISGGSLALASGGLWGRLAMAESTSPNEKLNIGIIGVANRAAANLGGVRSQNIVALCDIDDNYLNKAKAEFAQAKSYNDFRKLLEQKDIDAVVISTADHTHAPAAAGALRLGKHVYCEKPLTHSVYEARTLAQLAAKYKCATQMGTQIHAGDNYRRVVELIQAGAVGPVRDVHVWVGKGWGGGDRPKQTPEIPANLHWDLWLGPAPARPYHSTYLPANWRRWWDFGGGTLGDMGCHYVDLPFWALKLRHPTKISAEGPPVHAETAPTQMTAYYEFPARGDQPAVKLTWYDGGRQPSQLAELGLKTGWGSGVLFIGDKGVLAADYGRAVLLPQEKFADYKRPEPTIPKSVGHYQEWFNGCKTGSPTTCNFDYSGALTETILLGNVAYRTGKTLEWDAEKLAATNCDEAAQYIRREYRQGWEL